MWARITLIAFLFGLVWLGWRISTEYRAVLATGPTSWTQEVQAECGVVLTGGAGRIREGVDLLYRGAVKKLIIAGVHPGVELREILPQWPLYGSLKEEDVVLERRSMTTYGNAVQALPLVEALHCRSVALVTSTVHMHRAFMTFRGVFPVDYPIVAHAVVSGSLRASFSDAFAETFKSAFYSFWAY